MEATYFLLNLSLLCYPLILGSCYPLIFTEFIPIMVYHLFLAYGTTFAFIMVPLLLLKKDPLLLSNGTTFGFKKDPLFLYNRNTSKKYIKEIHHRNPTLVKVVEPRLILSSTICQY